MCPLDEEVIDDGECSPHDTLFICTCFTAMIQLASDF